MALLATINAAMPGLCDEMSGGSAGIAAASAVSQKLDDSTSSGQALGLETGIYPRHRQTNTEPAPGQLSSPQSSPEVQAVYRQARSDIYKNSQLCGFAMAYLKAYGRGWQVYCDKETQLPAGRSKSVEQSQREADDFAGKVCAELEEWYAIDYRDMASQAFSNDKQKSLLDRDSRMIAFRTGFRAAYNDASVDGAQDFAETDTQVRRTSHFPGEDSLKSKRYRRMAKAVYAYADKIGVPFTEASAYLDPVR